MDDTQRSGKALIDATRRYAAEDVGRSWWHTLSTLAVHAGVVAAAVLLPWWPLQLAFSVLAGLMVVRTFILYHDHLHGALLGHSTIARAIFYAYGVLVLTPPRVWRQTHNYHHAHTAKIVGSHIGSYAMLTTEMWAQATPGQRLLYKITRHPLTVLFGYFTIFLYGMCLSSFRRNPRKHWDSALALVLHVTLGAALWSLFGPSVFFTGFVIPLFIGHCIGAYLFYAQHNFPDTDVQPREQWSFVHASIESSSFMKLGPVMSWFTGNIGYHHVHHLNPAIPFYRLPETMSAIPELQRPGVTTLRPRDIVACFRLKLWDPEKGRMVGYPAEP